ncbi:MAG TPA: hypothetical protein VLT59_00360, partial [Steroidobacteraceae bacterium]|nr:hypothetical protein [Steroidobacteraceae bacterium]
ESRPEPGQPVDVEVLLTASVGVDTLEATISGMEGLRVLSPAEPTFSATALAAGDELRQTITLVPETAGVYYASILVKTDGDTGLQARTFAIPLVVGAVAAAAEKPAETDAGGERIRSMPAQENGA